MMVTMTPMTPVMTMTLVLTMTPMMTMTLIGLVVTQ